MRKVLLLFFLLTIPSSAQNIVLNVVYSPEIKSEFESIVFIPSETTPYEFTGYIEEKLKNETKIPIIKRSVFADFLKREKIGERRIDEKDLIKIYKAFGKINIVFLNLQNLKIEKRDVNNKPCKEGKINFSISIFNSRDGILLKNKTIEFDITVCSKTPVYPDTKRVIEALFSNSAKEIIKTMFPRKETIKIPFPYKKCKMQTFFEAIKTRNFKKAEKLLSEKRNCFEKTSDYNLAKGLLLLFSENFEKAKDIFEKEKNEIPPALLVLANTPKENILAMSLEIETSSQKKEQKDYVYHYRNSADILLEQLSKLEKMFKEGKISEKEYMKRKYKLIEKF